MNDDNELNEKVCLLCNQLLSKLVVGSLEKLGSSHVSDFGDCVSSHLAVSYGQIDNFLAQVVNSLTQRSSQAMTVF